MSSKRVPFGSPESCPNRVLKDHGIKTEGHTATRARSAVGRVCLDEMSACGLLKEDDANPPNIWKNDCVEICHRDPVQLPEE